MKLSETTPSQIKNAEGEIVAALLEDWQHTKKTGEALEKRAKELIKQGVIVANDEVEWELKPGAKMKGLSDMQTAVSLILKDKMLKISSQELLDICTLPMGKLTDLIATKLAISKPNAELQLAATLGDVLTLKPKAPSLKRVPK